ncbi:hypothetical protein GTK09_26445 [Jiella sp. 40Bstr34]|uniref:Bartonella effector protein BID domain-containing protein n=1 Tax=Jiella pacifica TaxID=2696469 RepID=A0A6N9TGF1_9HYPH|nr:hypothetical protein [Jiella pacifica]
MLQTQWENVSHRIRLVYAEPETAFAAMRMDAVMADSKVAAERLSAIDQNPESFGALRGRDGLFAGKTDREARRVAMLNGPALHRDLKRYLEMRETTREKLVAAEEVQRERLSIDIPGLSPAAGRVLEKVRDAIDRNDLPAALGFAFADRMVKAELDAFDKAVCERFGDRAFLSLDAKEPKGRVFEKAAAGLAPAEREKLAESWPLMRTGQQVAAQERTQVALKEADAMRQSQRQSQTVKQ